LGTRKKSVLILLGNCFIQDLILVMAMVLEREIAFYSIVILFAAAISIIALDIDDSNAMDVSIRLLALNGYVALSIAAVLTPFIKEVTLFFKKSFIKVHHYFTAAACFL
jgi:hypothetical protein